jgi:hypothetical protein
LNALIGLEGQHIDLIGIQYQNAINHHVLNQIYSGARGRVEIFLSDG